MDKSLILLDLSLPGLKLIKRNPISDSRGYLSRLYCKDTLDIAGLTDTIAQINITLTKTAGTVRGMHFQHPPFAETKIMTCLRGKIFDVAVDLRKSSSTFLQWHAEILSPELNNSIIIPKGFAHGFQSLNDNSELLYLHTAPYHPASEGGLSPLDPILSIHWPLAITSMSDRDKGHALLTDQFKGLLHAM